MRRSDLVDADLEAARAELDAATDVVREPAGVDAIWRAASLVGAR
jgi:hypothetical protein